MSTAISSTLVVIRRDGEASVHDCKIELDVSSDQLTKAILNSLKLMSGEYELYVKLQPDVNLSSIDIDAEDLIVISRSIKAKEKSNTLFK